RRSLACRRRRCSSRAPIVLWRSTAWRRRLPRNSRWPAMLRDGASRLLVFRLGTELFGVDLAAVEQVVDAPESKPIPDSPVSVRGLTSLQGELVTLYDLQHLLNVRPRAIHAALVFRRGDRRLAVAVEDVF